MTDSEFEALIGHEYEDLGDKVARYNPQTGKWSQKIFRYDHINGKLTREEILYLDADDDRVRRWISEKERRMSRMKRIKSMLFVNSILMGAAGGFLYDLIGLWACILWIIAVGVYSSWTEQEIKKL